MTRAHSSRQKPRLQAKVNVRQVSSLDILPEEPQHWTNLTATRRTSETLVEFIDTELLEERKARLGLNGASAFKNIALTFASPGLVPHALFDSLDKETMIAALEQACTFEDHFSLLGAFETCARLVTKDQRFVDLRHRLLDRLFADMERLQTSCGVFGAIRAAKADGTAAWGLMGISFAYGIFHAAGPGHGKAVISSYLVVNNETWRRGIALSFASAVLQSFTAIAIVGIAAVLLGATAHVMGNRFRGIEMVSYGLINETGLASEIETMEIVSLALEDHGFWPPPALKNIIVSPPAAA